MPTTHTSLEPETVSRLYRDHIHPDLPRLLKFSGLGTLELQAEGCHVRDHREQEYLDLCGGYGVFSLGHRHPEVVAAVREQLERLPLSPRVFFSPLMAELAQELARLAPGRLQYSFFCNSGTEAVEGALKLARIATGRIGLVAADNAFHGKTFGSLSVSGRPTYREPFEPLLPGVRHVPYGELAALDEAVDDGIAAVILEPVQGEGGIHVPPDGYLQGALELCHSRGALLIADEVQTGLGRTGRMFAVEHWSVEPDLLCLAKALGGGIMPIGAFMGTPEVWRALRGRPTLHTSTFGGNPMACAAALATLRVLEREDLPGRARTTGAELRQRLESVRERYPDVIREVRGLGLLLGIELVDEGVAGSVLTEMVRRHVIAVYTMNQPRVIRFEPPLTFGPAEIRQAVEALEGACEATRERLTP
ncbi:MAG: aminotransferase class III-fold pyridoxal phosphate-dependent enzyme [Armatimonadetes bacterium]|nr:aminotransferase class III-fold pyridoxal phosphate-dependent enzyme [Armatimonadota bacterium]